MGTLHFILPNCIFSRRTIWFIKLTNSGPKCPKTTLGDGQVARTFDGIHVVPSLIPHANNVCMGRGFVPLLILDKNTQGL